MDYDLFTELLKKQADIIIAKALENAMRYVHDLLVKEGQNVFEIGNIRWVSCKDFTVPIGARQIEEYISVFPVEVYFFFESNKLMHRPGHSRFKEKWLKDIIESKILLMQEVDF
uniref:A-kinase anchor protein 14 isoform X2 n=1 Tax=Pristiophorus japonicus TaxID=55135 RepID=UPI00398E62AD